VAGADAEVVPAVAVEVRVELNAGKPRLLRDLVLRGHPLEEIEVASGKRYG
jgi:hypothetical protein